MAQVFGDRTHLEEVKEGSRGLRGTIGDEIGLPDGGFSADNAQLLKFHGVYQQDNRDEWPEGVRAKVIADHRFMVRTKFPGGRLTAAQYLVCDSLACEYADDDLRVTSRQNIQFHGILKQHLQTAIQQLNRAGGITTFGAAGDVVRNVVAPPVADIDPRSYPFGASLLALADRINTLFAPHARGYRNLWVEGGESLKPSDEDPEPFYSSGYLPRKFKIAIATEFDNSTDVLANDVGLLAVTESRRLRGYEMFVGGGLGFSRASGDSDSRLAQPFAFVEESLVIPAITAILEVFRDHGCRTNRRRARLKYLLQDWGMDRFRKHVTDALGRRLDPPLGVVPSGQLDYLGWHEQTGSNLYYVGIRLGNGRIRDFSEAVRFKTGLREVVRHLGPGVRLTPEHNIILTHVLRGNVAAVETLLNLHGIPTPPEASPLRRLEMACPALPYCGMAFGEAERVLPQILRAVERDGHADADVQVRMSGCTNGCSRPRTAEIGIIGSGAGRYDVYVGGSRVGLRLNYKLDCDVATEHLARVISRLLTLWKRHRFSGESFGDWSLRVDASALCESMSTIPGEAPHCAVT